MQSINDIMNLSGGCLEILNRGSVMKITFMGAGSTVFARNVIGDCMCSEALRDSVFALYDIDGQRLEESRVILEARRQTKGG